MRDRSRPVGVREPGRGPDRAPVPTGSPRPVPLGRPSTPDRPTVGDNPVDISAPPVDKPGRTRRVPRGVPRRTPMLPGPAGRPGRSVPIPTRASTCALAGPSPAPTAPTDPAVLSLGGVREEQGLGTHGSPDPRTGPRCRTPPARSTVKPPSRPRPRASRTAREDP